MRQGILLGVGLAFLVPQVAWAHVAFVDPAPRSGDNGLIAEPCGEVAPTGNPTQFQAGETITVSWAVGQPHGGSLRIDFAEMNDMGFDQNILAMDVSDAEGMPESMDVTLPNVNCDACTLRIIQINPDEDDYVSCADVQLMGAIEGTTGGDDSSGGGDSSGGAGSSDGGGSSGGGDQGTGPLGDDSSGGGGDDGADDAPMPGDGSGTAGGDTTGGPDAEGDDAGGCGCTSSPASAPAWMLLLGLVALRRRAR
jgi:MYXO-CTERM domain-containing protein